MVGGYIYEVVEGWVAGVEGGEGDEVGREVIVVCNINVTVMF